MISLWNSSFILLLADIIPLWDAQSSFLSFFRPSLTHSFLLPTLMYHRFNPITSGCHFWFYICRAPNNFIQHRETPRNQRVNNSFPQNSHTQHRTIPSPTTTASLLWWHPVTSLPARNLIKHVMTYLYANLLKLVLS